MKRYRPSYAAKNFLNVSQLLLRRRFNCNWRCCFPPHSSAAEPSSGLAPRTSTRSPYGRSARQSTEYGDCYIRQDVGAVSAGEMSISWPKCLVSLRVHDSWWRLVVATRQPNPGQAPRPGGSGCIRAGPQKWGAGKKSLPLILGRCNWQFQQSPEPSCCLGGMISLANSRGNRRLLWVIS